MSCALQMKLLSGPIPLSYGVVNFHIPNFGHFPYPLVNSKILCPVNSPCPKCICPECDVLCLVLYIVLSMSCMSL